MNTKPKEPSPEDFDISTEEWEVIKKSKEKDWDSGSKVGCGVYIGGFLGGGFGGMVGSGDLGIWVGLVLGAVLVPIIWKKKPELALELRQKNDRYQSAFKQYASDLYRYNKHRNDWWFSLSGHDFEAEFGKLLKEHGYAVKPTKGSGDGGIDLYAYENDKEIIIQCKAWKNEVGPGPVRELQGVREPNQDAWFVGLGGFTSGAREFAKAKGIRLFEYRDVLKLVAED